MKKAYIAWNCGIVSIREVGTDNIVWTDRKEYSILNLEIAWEKAENRAKRMGYTISE